MRYALIGVVVALASPALAQSPLPLRDRIILAEDARAQAPADEAALRQALGNRDPNVRQQAIRAIGRLERPELMAALTRPLADPVVAVRIEAANAIGQLAKGDKAVAGAKGRLLARARVEQEPRVWAVVAATLGRLAYADAKDVDQVEETIARVLPGANTQAIQIDAVLGAVEGLEALARQSGKISKLKPTTLDGLRAAASLEGRAEDAEKLTRIRRLATLALTAAGGVTRPRLEAGAADPDAEVRRLTMAAARAEIEGREPIVRKGLADSNPQVRYEALQTWGRAFRATSCQPIREALGDRDPHVALLAIDLAGECPADVAADELERRAKALGPQPGAWHGGAHALVALAKAAPERARPLLAAAAAHEIWQVRMYAARAAGVLDAREALTRLAGDRHHNVREAALMALITLKSPEAAALGIEALTATDYQLVMTAARAAAGSTDTAAAVAALTQAFDRIAAERKDTSRDAQNAIREALTQLGGPSRPAPAAQPAVAPRLDGGALDRLRGTRLRFAIAGRGTFAVRLLVDAAPVTALHVATLAGDGYYTGKTFHRVVPNFVIQGGSPGANEYAGQAAFMRDEVGLVSHTRGTVGISTRGRDTGDAQIFVNLVDSPRLDHTYTVFAEVVEGIDVVDAILEGDVIERVETVAPQSE